MNRIALGLSLAASSITFGQVLAYESFEYPAGNLSGKDGGLGFGLLGSTLSLPFGLYVLFCQRVPEQYLKNHVTGVNTNRALFGAAVLIFAVATLLPMAPTDLDILQATI